MGLIGIVSGLLSIVTYKYIVSKQGSNTAFFIGFGILIPLWSFFPFQLIELLDIRNKIIKFGVSAVIPVLGIFKTTEGELSLIIVEQSNVQLSLVEFEIPHGS